MVAGQHGVRIASNQPEVGRCASELSDRVGTPSNDV